MEMSTINADSAVAVRLAKIRRRKIMTIAVAVILIAVVVFAIVKRAGRQNDPLGNLATAKVERTTITQVISATGSVTAQTGADVKIGSQITGRIKQLSADVGSKVKTGQVIAELDLPDIKAQLDQAIANRDASRLKLQEQLSGVSMQATTVKTDIAKARAGVLSAQASYSQAVQNAKAQVSASQSAVAQAKATNNNAQTFVKRNRQLLAQGYIAAQDVDNAQAQADVAKAQLDSAQQNLSVTRVTSATTIQTALNAVQNAKAVLQATYGNTANNTVKAQQVAEARAALEQAQAQVAFAQAQYQKTVIRSPISGTVLSLAVQQGETIAAGLSSPTLIRVTDLNRLQVDVFVDESDIGSLRLGQSATITVDAYPNRTFRGHVIKIASGATMQQSVVTYDTTIALDNPEGLLKPDMTATAKIVVGDFEDVLAVPVEAVKFGPRGQVIYVLQGKKVVIRPVVTGVSNDTVTQIIKGAKEGQTVVLAGYTPQATGGGGGGAMSPFGPMGGGRRGGTGGGGRRGGG
jgi:HlyD family secretion protein